MLDPANEFTDRSPRASSDNGVPSAGGSVDSWFKADDIKVMFALLILVLDRI
jgi:hypothetical protein